MTEAKDTAAILREAFKAEEIGKLPRVTCPKCSDRNNRKGTCDEHPSKEKCGECKAYVSPRHIHIDYVGHADVTSRLLEADPLWNWEPAASDEHGLPVFDHDDQGAPVGLWIRLTVGGVTRLGYGSVPSGQKDAVKVLIGDALRNAAMRFGVALDLWAKGDRADPAAENATASGGQAQRRRPRQQPREEAGPSEPSADQDDGDWGVWHDVIKDITTPEEADQADQDLREVFKTGAMGPTKAGNIRAAIQKRKADVAGPRSPNGKRREEVPA